MTAPSWLVARPIAHRGLHDESTGIIENTIRAAAAAVAAGFAIECDVQLTADGEAVVFHDFDLERLTGQRGPVRERRASELARFAVGSTPEGIAPLADLLAFVRGRVPLVVEIKSRFDGDLSLADRVAEVASSYEGPVALKAWDPAIVAHLRWVAPALPRGVVARTDFGDPHWDALDPGRKWAMANLLHTDETRPDFLSWCVDDLPCAATHLGRRLGGWPVLAWTVREQGQRQRARAHADQIVFEGFRPQA